MAGPVDLGPQLAAGGSGPADTAGTGWCSNGAATVGAGRRLLVEGGETRNMRLAALTAVFAHFVALHRSLLVGVSGATESNKAVRRGRFRLPATMPSVFRSECRRRELTLTFCTNLANCPRLIGTCITSRKNFRRAVFCTAPGGSTQVSPICLGVSDRRWGPADQQKRPNRSVDRW